MDLAKVYTLIEDAEKHAQQGSLLSAQKIFEDAAKQLAAYVQNNDEEKLGLKMREALILLKEDVDTRVRELSMLIMLQNTSQNVANNESLPMVGSMIMNASNTGVSPDVMWTINHDGSLSDPFLNNLFNKLQENLTKSLVNGKITRRQLENRESVSTTVDRHLLQFKKELRLYEQHRCKGMNIKFEELTEKNKRLTLHVNKLREKWDSLIESAKQKRNRQAGEE